MTRKVVIYFLGIIMLGILIAASAQVSSATPDTTVKQTLTAVSGNVRLTATAIKQRIAQTATAIHNNVAGTATAIHNNIAGTATAIHDNVAGTATQIHDNVAETATAIHDNIAGTLTAIAPTIQSYRSNLDMTLTAIEATLTAVPQNIEATLTTYAPTLDSIKSTLALTKIPGDQAAATLTSYGAQTYGDALAITKAGGANYNIVGTYKLPEIIFNVEQVSANLAAQTYIGETANGVLWLFEGDGTLTNPATNKTANVQSESLGIYTESVAVSGQLDANSALALAKSAFPALASASYSPATVSQGYAFYSLTVTYTIDPVSKQAVATPEAILLTVVPGANGNAYVTAAVGTGIYSAAVQA